MNKAGKTTITLSTVLILVLLTASIYIFMPEQVKLKVEDTKSEFYVWENDAWVLGATEYVHLYDGTTKMRASSRDVTYVTEGDITKIIRTAEWKDNISTIDTYTFDSTSTDVTLFPISHILEITNAVGKIVHFEYRDIGYDGETREANSPESFDHQMKIEWQDGNYYAKVFQQTYASDKLIIRYRPQSDYEVYSVRMFDPPAALLSPTASGANSQTYLGNFNTITADFLNQTLWNTSQTFTETDLGVEVLWVPWMDSSSYCAESNLKEDYTSGTASWTNNEMVTDEYSEVGIILSRSTEEDDFYKWYSLLAELESSTYDGLACWAAIKVGNDVTCVSNDTASDATARVGLALYYASNNDRFSDSTQKAAYKTAADAIAQKHVEHEAYYGCKTSHISGEQVCYWPMGGGDTAGSVGGTGGADLWIGYVPDLIDFMLAAYASTENNTFKTVAEDYIDAYLIASFDDYTTDGVAGAALSNGYGMAPKNFVWNHTGTDVSIYPASGETYHYTVANGAWDNADAPRALGICNNLRNALSIYESVSNFPTALNNLSDYCSAWSSANEYTNISSYLQYYYNGTGFGSLDEGWYTNGLGIGTHTWNDTDTFDDKMDTILTKYGFADAKPYAQSSCFGVYQGVRGIKALGTGIQEYDDAYTLETSSSSVVNISFNTFKNTDVVVEDGSEINISAESNNSAATVCLSADIDSLGDDFSCGTGSTWYLWNASSENNLFNDSSTYKEVDFTSAPEDKNVTLESFKNNSIITSGTFYIAGNESLYSSSTSVYLEADESGTACSGNYDSLHTCAHTYDESLSTYGTPDNNGDTIYSYQNFTCGSCVGTISSAVVEHTYYYGFNVETDNDTLSGCELNPVQLRFQVTESDGGIDYYKVDCIDDTNPTYNNVFTFSQSDSFGWYRFYEASVYFNDTSLITNYDSDVPTNVLIDFNDDGVIDGKVVGILGSDYTRFTTFGNGSSSIIMNLSGVDSSEVTNISITPDFDGYIALLNVSGSVQDSFEYEYGGGYYDNDPYSYSDGTVERAIDSISLATDDATQYFYRFGGDAHTGKCQDDGNEYNCSVKIDVDGGIGSVTSLANVPYDVGQHGCGVYDPVNSQFIIMGGVANTTYKNNVYAYDISGDSWSSLASMSYPLAFHHCTYLDGKIYVNGGYTTGNAVTYSDKMNVYNISDNTWYSLTDSNYGKLAGRMEAINSTHLFSFGYYYQTEMYDITADSWTTKDFLSYDSGSSYQMWGYGSHTTPDGEYVYVFGGIYSLGYISQVQRYDVSANTWEVLTNSDWNSGAISYDDTINIENTFYHIGSAYGNDLHKSIFHIYPTDVVINFGDASFQRISGGVSTSQQLTDFASTITSYASTCTKNTDGSCYLPVTITTSMPGYITLEGLEILQTVGEINFGAQTVTCDSSDCNPVINFESETNGTLNVSNVSMLFYGTDTINFTADDETYTTSNTVTNYFTNYTYMLPGGTEYISFYPFSTYTNTTPFGQTSTTPILDLTAENIDNNSNLSFKIVETDTCFNYYWKSFKDEDESFEEDFGDWTVDPPLAGTIVERTENWSSDGDWSVYMIYGGSLSSNNANMEKEFENNATVSFDIKKLDTYGALVQINGVSSFNTHSDPLNTTTTHSFTVTEGDVVKITTVGDYSEFYIDNFVSVPTINYTYYNTTSSNWISVWEDKEDGHNEEFYLTASYDCSSSYTQYFSPEIYLRSCTVNADICDEDVS